MAVPLHALTLKRPKVGLCWLTPVGLCVDMTVHFSDIYVMNLGMTSLIRETLNMA